MNIGQRVLFQLFIGQHGRAVRGKLGYGQKGVAAFFVQFFPRGFVAENFLRFPVRGVRAGGADIFLVEFLVLRRLGVQYLAAGIVILAQVFFRLLQLFGLFRELFVFGPGFREPGTHHVKRLPHFFRAVFFGVAQCGEDLMPCFFRRVLQRLADLAQVTDFQAELLRLGKAAFSKGAEVA